MCALRSSQPHSLRSGSNLPLLSCTQKSQWEKGFPLFLRIHTGKFSCAGLKSCLWSWYSGTGWPVSLAIHCPFLEYRPGGLGRWQWVGVVCLFWAYPRPGQVGGSSWQVVLPCLCICGCVSYSSLGRLLGAAGFWSHLLILDGVCVLTLRAPTTSWGGGLTVCGVLPGVEDVLALEGKSCLHLPGADLCGLPRFWARSGCLADAEAWTCDC
jgi:hypothetical protein